MSEALHRARELMYLDRAGALEPGEQSELRALLASLEPTTRGHLERDVAADFEALDSAFERTDVAHEEPAPSELLARLHANNPANESSSAPSRGSIDGEPQRGSISVVGWIGWAAAAGLAVVVMLQSMRPQPAPVVPPSVRSTVDAAGDAVRIALASNDSSAPNASGTVVWSQSLQRGYLDLRGMPVNDPRAQQYQLWIVDPSRAEQPIDAGVFDVTAPDAIVPFQPKLAIATPQVFAVTAEKPGGVVVTDGPMLLVGKPG